MLPKMYRVAQDRSGIPRSPDLISSDSIIYYYGANCTPHHKSSYVGMGRDVGGIVPIQQRLKKCK